jgi:FixJ family two-component response regulator
MKNNTERRKKAHENRKKVLDGLAHYEVRFMDKLIFKAYSYKEIADKLKVEATTFCSMRNRNSSKTFFTRNFKIIFVDYSDR